MLITCPTPGLYSKYGMLYIDAITSGNFWSVLALPTNSLCPFDVSFNNGWLGSP